MFSYMFSQTPKNTAEQSVDNASPSTQPKPALNGENPSPTKQQLKPSLTGENPSPSKQPRRPSLTGENPSPTKLKSGEDTSPSKPPRKLSNRAPVVPAEAPKLSPYQVLLGNVVGAPRGSQKISEILTAAENESDAILEDSLTNLLKLRENVTGNSVLQVLVISSNFKLLNKLLKLIEKKSDQLEEALSLLNDRGQTIFHTIAEKAASKYQEIAINLTLHPKMLNKILMIKEKETGNTAMHLAARNEDDKESSFLTALLKINKRYVEIQNIAGNTPSRDHITKIGKLRNAIVKAKEEEIENLKKESEDVFKKLQEERDALHKKDAAKISELEGKLKAENAKFVEAQDGHLATMKEISDREQETNKTIKDLNTEIQNISAEIAKLRKENEGLRKENKELNQAIAALHTVFPNYKLDDIIKKYVADQADEKKQLEAQLDAVKKEKGAANQERDDLSRKVLTLQQELEGLKTEKENLETSKTKLENQITELESKKPPVQPRPAPVVERIAAAAPDSSKIKDLEAQVEELKAQNKKYKDAELERSKSLRSQILVTVVAAGIGTSLGLLAGGPFGAVIGFFVGIAYGVGVTTITALIDRATTSKNKESVDASLEKAPSDLQNKEERRSTHSLVQESTNQSSASPSQESLSGSRPDVTSPPRVQSPLRPDVQEGLDVMKRHSPKPTIKKKERTCGLLGRFFCTLFAVVIVPTVKNSPRNSPSMRTTPSDT